MLFFFDFGAFESDMLNLRVMPLQIQMCYSGFGTFGCIMLGSKVRTLYVQIHCFGFGTFGGYICWALRLGLCKCKWIDLVLVIWGIIS